MLNILMIALFIILRIVIPATVLLSLGEMIKRRAHIPGNLQGA